MVFTICLCNIFLLLPFRVNMMAKQAPSRVSLQIRKFPALRHRIVSHRTAVIQACINRLKEISLGMIAIHWRSEEYHVGNVQKRVKIWQIIFCLTLIADPAGSCNTRGTVWDAVCTFRRLSRTRRALDWRPYEDKYVLSARARGLIVRFPAKKIGDEFHSPSFITLCKIHGWGSLFTGKMQNKFSSGEGRGATGALELETNTGSGFDFSLDWF